MKWPDGVASVGSACGIKADGSADLGMLVFDPRAAWAGMFTTNAAAAAPVRWSRQLMGHPVRAVVVNSGNANACTGLDGEAAARRCAVAAASALGCAAEEVLVASTGPIGVRLPADRVTLGIVAMLPALNDEVEEFARAILTTDTRTKVSVAAAGDARVVGVAKGAAMVAPNMATMLAFIATDAALDASTLKTALFGAVGRSFNRICVDACESTNDSVFLFSTGRTPVAEEGFVGALQAVCRDLAQQIVGDAEGGSRVVHIVVEGAERESSAVAMAHAVAASALWRAALHGGDPNWGRVLAALGSAAVPFDPERATVHIGEETVFERGEPTGSLEAAAKWMDGQEVIVTCVVGDGRGRAEVLTADLSPEYVVLNAEGTS